MKKTKVVVGVLLALSILAAALLSVYSFLLQSQRVLKQETYRTLTEMSQHYNKAFVDRIENHLDTLSIIAETFGMLENPTEDTIVHMLESTAKSSGLTRVIVAGMDGISYSNDKKVVDVTDREYYKAAIKGGRSVTGPLTSIVDKNGTLMLAVPIDSGGKISGILCGMYSLTTAGYKLLDDSYYSDGNGFVVSANGDIVISSDHENKLCDEKNLLAFFDKTTFVDTPHAWLTASMANGQSGTFAFIYNGERRFASFMPSGINGWYTFSLASDRLIRQQEADTGSLVLTLVIKLTSIAILIVAIILYGNRRHSRQMLRANQRYLSMINNINGGVVLMAHSNDAHGIKATYVSNGFTEMTGYSLEDIQTQFGGEYVQILHPDDWSAALATHLEQVAHGNNYSMSYRIVKKDGGLLWVLDTGFVVTDEHGISINHSILTDISGMKRNTEYLETQAQLDPLTGLYNKTATGALVNRIFSSAPDKLHALIILDIDNFKGVNDTLGHAFGDAVLMDVCAKLKALFRSNDIVGRIGGDEFAVLMQNVPDKSLILKKAAEIGGIFRRTYAGEKGDYKISCSVGIALFEDEHDSFETLCPKADAALYQAKRSGKDMFVLYQEEDAKHYQIGAVKPNDDEPRGLSASWSIDERIFTLMYDSRDFFESVNMALAMIGQMYHISRTYVFENDAGNTRTRNTYEWCAPGITAEIDNLQSLDISEGADSILNCYDENGLFYCDDVAALAPYPRQILESQGIRATLQSAIVNDGKIRGFIGFDDCKEERVWTAAEIDTLSFLAKILGIFLFKKNAEAVLTETLNSRLTILDSLPDYICVINPENHAIEYANRRIKELIPRLAAGVFCYTALRGGQDGPCAECLVERIKRGDTDNLEIVSEDKAVRLKVRALYIDWQEHKKMVLLYGAEPV